MKFVFLPATCHQCGPTRISRILIRHDQYILRTRPSVSERGQALHQKRNSIGDFCFSPYLLIPILELGFLAGTSAALLGVDCFVDKFHEPGCWPFQQVI